MCVYVRARVVCVFNLSLVNDGQNSSLTITTTTTSSSCSGSRRRRW